MKRLGSIVLALALCAGIAHAGSEDATEREADRLAGLVLDRMLANHARVIGVADRIRIAAAPYCGKEVGAVLGVFVADQKTFLELVSRDNAFEEHLQRAATQRFALDQHPHVLVAPAGLPAAEAGVRAGDVVTRINGKTLNRRDHLHALRTRDARDPIGLTVERAGEPVELHVPLRIGCSYPAQSWFGSPINAFARRFGRNTGSYVIYGLLDFLPSDDDLAVILGHELAHLILDNGGTRRTEAEADYLGLYLAARAGYDVAGAPEVWRRIGRANPFTTIDWGFYAHPNSAARASEVDATVAEIAATGRTGTDLAAPELGTVLDRPVVGEAAAADATARMRAEALADLQTIRERLLRVSYTLRTRAIALCGDEIAPVLGAAIARRRDVIYGKESEAEEIFGLVDEPQVLAVLPGSPAAEAGLAPSDLVMRVNGEAVAKTQDAFNALREHREKSPVITISREGKESELAVPLVMGCQHEAMLVMRGSFDTNADRNGEELRVPEGLLRFAADDDELAFALAHQLAHNLRDNTQITSADDEPPADLLALQIVTSAGFDGTKAPALLERMVQYEPTMLFYEPEGFYSTHYSHGAIAERLIALRAALAERNVIEAAPN